MTDLPKCCEATLSRAGMHAVSGMVCDCGRQLVVRDREWIVWKGPMTELPQARKGLVRHFATCDACAMQGYCRYDANGASICRECDDAHKVAVEFGLDADALRAGTLRQTGLSAYGLARPIRAYLDALLPEPPQ